MIGLPWCSRSMRSTRATWADVQRCRRQRDQRASHVVCAPREDRRALAQRTRLRRASIAAQRATPRCRLALEPRHLAVAVRSRSAGRGLVAGTGGCSRRENRRAHRRSRRSRPASRAHPLARHGGCSARDPPPAAGVEQMPWRSALAADGAMRRQGIPPIRASAISSGSTLADARGNPPRALRAISSGAGAGLREASRKPPLPRTSSATARQARSVIRSARAASATLQSVDVELLATLVGDLQDQCHSPAASATAQAKTMTPRRPVPCRISAAKRGARLSAQQRIAGHRAVALGAAPRGSSLPVPQRSPCRNTRYRTAARGAGAVRRQRNPSDL